MSFFNKNSCNSTGVQPFHLSLFHKETQGRAWILDALRGFAILVMIVYHGLWNLVYLYGFSVGWFQGLPGTVVQVAGSAFFIALSGFCLSLGRKNLRQGLLLLGAGLLITIITGFTTPAYQVHFGILTLLGASTLVTAALKKPLGKIPPLPGIALSLGLALLLWNARDGSLGFSTVMIATIPPELYQNSLTAFLGFPPASFHSGDYFPLLPYLFFFWLGFFLYPLLINAVNKTRGKSRLRPLCWVGRHSLVIYLLHQPVLYGVMTVLPL